MKKNAIFCTKWRKEIWKYEKKVVSLQKILNDYES